MEDGSRTVWCGNLSEKVTEELLYELFLQAAPLERVRIPQDNRTGRKSNYAFIVCKHEQSVPYVVQLFNGITMFEKRLLIQPRSRNQTIESSPIQNEQFSVKDRLGKRCNDLPRNISPGMLPPLADMTRSGVLGLLHLGQMMNAATMQHDYVSTHDDRQRDIRNNRDYRRDDRNPYGRNNRRRNHDSKYDGYQHRKY